MPFWRPTTSQAFATEVDQLGDSEASELLISGQLIRVKGWWRKGARFEQHSAEVRRAGPEGGDAPLLLWGRDDGSRRSLPLQGVAVECFPLDDYYGFRILPLPQSLAADPIDFATTEGDQRDLWMAAISIASAYKPKDPVAGVLHITLVEGTLTQDSKRLAALSPLPLQAGACFCVVSCNDLTCRTVARKPQKSQETPEGREGRVAFGDVFELAISNDDPDSLIQFQVWTTDYRNRGTLRGRVDVPLYAVGRKGQREMQLLLKDVYRPKGESCAVGYLKAWLSFDQSISALLLPRPTRPPLAAWQTVGTDKSIREQIKELEAFMQQFEVFSSRFMYHCDVSRGLSLEYKRIVQWDAPLLTVFCLLALTVLIGFFHEYTLPVAVLILLGVIFWYHPAARVDDLAELSELQDQPQSVRMLSGLNPAQSKGASEADDTEVKERYENERRLVLGRFTSKRLRLWDPPAWSESSGRRAEPPKPYEDGVQYSWRVEVNGFTDAEGWRYARHFGKGAIWRNTFQHQMFVRRRRHVGRPLNEGSRTPKENSSNRGELPGVETPDLKARTPRPSLLSSSGEMPMGRKESQTAAEGNEAKGLEFGIARTPFHDMYQQYLLRLSFLQRQIEYWMDWYERRKNLILGGTLETQNFALLLVLVLLVVAWLLPTRFLCLAFIYAIFWDGLAMGRLMREHRTVFLKSLKEAAMGWLETEEARLRAKSWTLSTSMDDLVDEGVQLLQVRDWIRSDYFAGRPMLPLRLIQRCRTIRELAAHVTVMSDCFAKRRQRARVWYRSTFRNLLEHVPSDITRFQPFVAKGLNPR